MSRPRPHRRRRLLAGLAPFALVLGALPLLAPTCGDGQPGVKTFARNSIIIPMDVCYQHQRDTVSYTPAACPQAKAEGDVIRAYGLVYQLIRSGIAVYWIIDPAKSTKEAIDLSIQNGSGPPVRLYDWSSGSVSGTPTSSDKIDYRGGPFVVDGSDFDRAARVLQDHSATFSGLATTTPPTSGVRVHVANVAFAANVAKTMAGGWNAGGSVPPKLALLDIGSAPGSSGAKNSEPIIRGYLKRAGLDFPGAGGTATANGHGQIYDRLTMADFQPSASGDWTTTNLSRYQYEILWVPHWYAPGSCSNVGSCSTSQYSDAEVTRALQTIGAFVARGHDVFAECAGLGSFEGVRGTTGDWNASYQQGIDPETHFHEETGLLINDAVSGVRYVGSFASPLMQLGDYPFTPIGNSAILNFKPSTEPYRPPVQQLIEDADGSGYDYFTILPPAPGSHGSVVYLGGHSYSGYSDVLGAGGQLVENSTWPFQIGATRLVLNTLFNLGAGCSASGVACSTGLLGVCALGTMQCDPQTQQPVCAATTGPSAEQCDGLDNDCNGLVDDGLTGACYDGPPTSLGTDGLPRGTCRSGVTSCERRADGSYAFTACQNQVLPAAEVCNGLDDDCDGTIDGLQQPCYTGPADTIDPATGLPRFTCQRGTQTCTTGAWGACDGQQLPRIEACQQDGGGNGADENCNGILDEGCTCNLGDTRPCYSGPPGTSGAGVCHGGTQTCGSSGWGACAGEATPTDEVCGDGEDDDCDGVVDDPTICDSCPPPGDPALVCAVTNPDGSPVARTNGQPAGECRDGRRTCSKSVFGACTDLIAPIPEICDAKDNDCDGAVDEDASCGAGLRCVSGVCVPSVCGAGLERRCPEGYDCVGGACVQGLCGTVTCAPGFACSYGSCVSPCDGVTCGQGASCASGECTSGSCYFTGCADGQICRSGACVADACAGVTCPAGTFCRSGDCVQSCAFQTCAAGERCTVDGFCEPDVCAGVTCAPGLRCDAGRCADDPCAKLSCGQGLTCMDGRCVDDPCAGITCPAGTCSAGQCYSVENLTGTPAAPPPGGESSGGGCGCGSGSASPLTGLLLLLALPLARRRARGTRFPVGLLLVAVSLAGAACKSEDPEPVPFDATACAETCGEQRCVEVAIDPAHCGACGFTCGAGETCVTGHCGATSPIAPYIASLSPSSGGKGSAAVQVELVGVRFAEGSSLRTRSPTASRTYAPCAAGQSGACLSVSDASHARVTLDLRDSPTTDLEVRVVTRDNVISNAATFAVTTPSPRIDAVTPSRVRIDTLGTVLVTGSGLAEASDCHIASASCRTTPGVCPFPEIVLPSTLVAEGLRCTLDPGLQPGSYDLWVVNEGTLASAPKDLVVDSAEPHIAALTPNSGEAEKIVSFSILGTGFDAATSVRYFVSGSATPLAVPSVSHLGPTEIRVTQLLLPACGAGSCTDKVQVVNGAGASNQVDFFRGAAPPQVLSLTVTPQPLYQGGTATLRFDGASLPTGTTIGVRPPVGDAIAITPSSADPAFVVGSLSLAGRPEGAYSANLSFPSGGTSSSFQFRVLSNAAVLFGTTPSGAAQGTTVNVTLKGSSFQSGARLRLASGATVLQDIATTYAPPDTLTATGLRVVDGNGVSLDTGVYQLQVVNPGAVPSNGLSFSVSPGAPTVSGVSPTSATRQAAPVTITITGTNFAKPDATGGGGSTVMVTSALMPGFANGPCPAPGTTPAQFAPAPGATTVNGTTRITVQLDTLSAVAQPGGTTYYVAVWNPGGNPPPQRSNGCTPLASLPSFTVFP